VTGDDSLPLGALSAERRDGRIIRHNDRQPDHAGAAARTVLQFRFDCGGGCQASTEEATSVDAGVQYDLPSAFRSAWARSCGTWAVTSVKSESASQIRRPVCQIGAQKLYRLPQTSPSGTHRWPSTSSTIAAAAPLPRVGAEFIWDSAVFIRGGYVVESADTEAGGASLGIGFVVRRLTIDFARSFSGLSADAGQAPTYLSLRVMF
jgi:hypothetical protein